jgi:hypothetical protein
MADDSKQSLPNIGGNGFIWILVAAATTYFVAHQIPLEGSRPATAGRSISEHVGEQHVDARLWQDPFAAVADALNKSPELKPENCDPHNSRYKDIEMYCRPPSEAPGAAPDLTLLVSVSGTPYSEDQEARRRKRYAVLAGLDAEGFAGGSTAYRVLLARRVVLIVTCVERSTGRAAIGSAHGPIARLTAAFDRGPAAS